MPKYEDISGRKFGRLTVQNMCGTDKYRNALCRCACECGNEMTTTASSLRKGHTKSCGCIKKKHGKCRTRLYNIYCNVISRCENPNEPAFPHYGARGITMCKEWRDDFRNFLNWASENGYSENLTLDRIDNNRGYSPDNCRWATTKEQARNTRRNILVTFRGSTKTLPEWCEELNLNYGTVKSRIRRGWTNPQEILFGKMKGELNNG